MSNKNKTQVAKQPLKQLPPKPAPSAEAASTESPTTPATDTKAAAKDSKTLENYTKEYATNPNAVMRKVNKVYMQKLLGKKLTWVEFCDAKIKAFTDCWEERKTNPEAGITHTIKPLTKEQAAKKSVELEKLLARVAAMKAALDLPTVEAEVKTATPADTVAATTNSSTSSDTEVEGDEEETE